MKQKYAIGVDVGGTKIALGIVDTEGKVHAKKKFPTDVPGGPLAVEQQIVSAIQELQAELHHLPFVGIGLGIAGQIEAKTGRVIFAPNLYWHNCPLRENIENLFHIPTVALNDVRAIALAEWSYGAGLGCDDVLYAFVGTGTGGAVVSGGHLLTGANNSLGEIGHMTVDINGPVCTCGKRGCFDALIGGWGIAARTKKEIEANPEHPSHSPIMNLAGGKIENITAKVVIDAYKTGDPLALKIINETKEFMIAGFASLVNIYNPQRLILGGGIIEALPETVRVIDTGIKKIALHSATQFLEVSLGKMGSDAGIIGAAVAAFKN